MDLVKFLTARLDEEASLAMAAGETRSGKVAEWWVDCPHEGHDAADCLERRVEGDNIIIYNEGGHDEDQARHIARHDPARVLAEVAAKRQLLADALKMAEDAADTEFWGLQNNAARIVQLLAMPYADHPDFQPEWRVDA